MPAQLIFPFLDQYFRKGGNIGAMGIFRVILSAAHVSTKYVLWFSPSGEWGLLFGETPSLREDHYSHDQLRSSYCKELGSCLSPIVGKAKAWSKFPFRYIFPRRNSGFGYSLNKVSACWAEDSPKFEETRDKFLVIEVRRSASAGTRSKMKCRVRLLSNLRTYSSGWNAHIGTEIEML